MEWIKAWRLRNLQGKLAVAQARLASYDYISRQTQTQTHDPCKHEQICAQLAVIKHRIERLLPLPKDPA